MKLTIKIIIIALLMANPCQIMSQIKIDTTNVGLDKIVLLYPQKSRVSITNYEEGFFKTINCLEDSALIELHYGALIKLPLIDCREKNITNEYIIADDIRQTRGFYYLNGKMKYFREDNLYKYGINIYYMNVPKEKLTLYESFLNSFEYIVK